MKITVSLLALAAAVAACSSSSSDDAPATPVPPAAEAGASPEASTPVDSSPPVIDASDAAKATCTAAEEALLKPVATVSTGAVTVLETVGAIKTLFIDASAGGPTGAATSPRVYVDLAGSARVEVSDVTAKTATAWDLAIERPILFTNGGDGGSGQGGAVLIAKAFDAVTTADASSATFGTESFFDAECKANVDQTGAVKTSFDGWYDYDAATNHLTPHVGTWLVKGGGGNVFKVEILSYYATEDGGVGQSGGRYTLRVGAL